MAVFEVVLPDLFEQYIEQLETNFPDLELYAIPKNIYSPDTIYPCVMLETNSMKRKRYLNDSRNINLSIKTTFAIRMPKKDALEARKKLLGWFGKVTDVLDNKFYTVENGSDSYELRGDILIPGALINLVDDEVYTIQTLKYDYAFDVVNY